MDLTVDLAVIPQERSPDTQKTFVAASNEPGKNIVQRLA